MALSALLSAGSAQAEEHYPDALGGYWGGTRSRLAASGLLLESAYTGEIVHNYSGGAGQGATRFGELDFKLTADGKKISGIPGLTAYLHALRTHGNDPAGMVGDAQGVSNIAAVPRWRLFEAWVQQNLPAHRMSVLLGRFDLNAEFYRLDASDLFLNASFGIGPEIAQTGQGGPSIFPDSAIGARIESRTKQLVVRAAVINGVPVAVPRADGHTGLHRQGDGVLLVGEVALLLPFNATGNERARSRRLRLGRAASAIERDTKIAVGGWHYTADFADLSRTAADGSALRQNGSSGGYLIGEQIIFRDAARPARRARVFVQLGAGDHRVGRFSSYTGLGFAFTGLFPGRADDELGFARASARNSPAYLEQQRALGGVPDSAETTYELTYLAVMRTWLSMQLSIQRVRHPNTDPALRDATLGQLRFEVVF